jgi:dethiobiotin synthetase
MLRGMGKRVAVYKPVASGCRIVDGVPVADDAIALWEAAGRPQTLHDVCPQRFLAPLAPPEAAAAEGKVVDGDLLRGGAEVWISRDFDLLIVEGAGGLMSPLADRILNIDLTKQFDSKLIVVVANRLGAIHQTLATCAAATHFGAPPHGIILCDTVADADASASSNAGQISRYCEVPILGSVPFGGAEEDVVCIQKLLN